jgi:carbonic anhydrase
MRRVSSLFVAALLAVPLLAEGSPEQLWATLEQGNRRYVGGSIHYDRLREQRQQVQDSQMPPVTVLACADSRVPPELVFDQSVGSLFVIRTAGNTADEFGLASIEYAIAHDWTRLLVVLGHESCGAVKAALEEGDPATPALRALVTRIRTSFAGIPYDSHDKANVHKAVDANARHAAAELLANSAVIRDAVRSGKVRVVSAYYELATGAVKKID